MADSVDEMDEMLRKLFPPQEIRFPLKRGEDRGDAVKRLCREMADSWWQDDPEYGALLRFCGLLVQMLGSDGLHMTAEHCVATAWDLLPDSDRQWVREYLGDLG